MRGVPKVIVANEFWLGINQKYVAYPGIDCAGKFPLCRALALR